MPAQGKRYTQISKGEMIDWENNIEVQFGFINPYTGRGRTKMYKVGQWINSMISSVYNFFYYREASYEYQTITTTNVTLTNTYPIPRYIYFNSGTTRTATLPNPVNADRQWFVFKNVSSVAHTIASPGTNLLENINGVLGNSFSLLPGQSCKIHSAGGFWRQVA